MQIKAGLVQMGPVHMKSSCCLWRCPCVLCMLCFREEFEKLSQHLLQRIETTLSNILVSASEYDVRVAG